MEQPAEPSGGSLPGAGLDDLERLLVGQRFPPVPAAWRGPILAAAGLEASAGSTRVPGTAPAHASWLDLLTSGWGLVGAAWVLVVCLHATAAPARQPSIVALPPLSNSAQAEMASQLAALGSLAGGPGEIGGDAPRMGTEAGPGATDPGRSPADPVTPSNRPRASVRSRLSERSLS